MKLQLKVAMAALMLGLGSAGMVYAGEDDDYGEEMGNDNCHTGQICGQTSIDVKMDINKWCKIRGFKKSELVLQNKQNGDSATAGFLVATNATYNLNLASKYAGYLHGSSGVDVPVTYKTTSGGDTLDLGDHERDAGVQHYQMTASIGYDPTLPNGTYEDTFTATVSF